MKPIFLLFGTQHIFLAENEKIELIFLDREDLDFLCEVLECKIPPSRGSRNLQKAESCHCANAPLLALSYALSLPQKYLHSNEGGREEGHIYVHFVVIIVFL